jgi:DNA polymerase-3 subunit epsilon
MKAQNRKQTKNNNDCKIAFSLEHYYNVSHAMLPQKIAFVDIETTGLRSSYDRIIEIGILRVEDNKLVKTFHSLFNPQTHIPPEITRITGLTGADLENAPTFSSVKDEILETLADCVFVAHNVRFDYSFILNELKRENISFSPKHFCTVRLSRLLYPSQKRHNLDALIERLNITCENRHRALDDARVLYTFYQKVQTEFAPEQLAEMIKRTMKKPSLPLHLLQTDLDSLPVKPGVYMFYGEDGAPLYIGKSVNIRNRVLSHFAADIHSPTEMKIAQQIKSIETITTAGELGALFLESKLIKERLPLYNRMSRIKHELIAIKAKRNKQGYQEVLLEPIKSISVDDLPSFYGFCKSRKQAKTYLATITKEFGLCEKLMGLEKTNTACFGYRLDRCKGACVGQEKAIMYNLKFDTAFAALKIKTWPYPGPIMIKESEFETKKEYFLVDKWCFMGSVTIDTEGNQKTDLSNNRIFDLDIYKILKQYLKNPAHQKKIKLLTEEQLQVWGN